MVYVTLTVQSSLDRRRENSGFARQWKRLHSLRPGCLGAILSLEALVG